MAVIWLGGKKPLAQRLRRPALFFIPTPHELVFLAELSPHGMFPFMSTRSAPRLDDTVVIETVERLRSFYLEQDHALADRLMELRSTSFVPRNNEEYIREAARLIVDPKRMETALARRQIHKAVHGSDPGGDKKIAPVQKCFADFREMRNDEHFLHTSIKTCENPEKAVSFVRSVFTFLTIKQAYLLLANCGEEVAQPSEPTLRLLFRLGAGLPPATSNARKMFLSVMQNIARVSCSSVREVDCLFGIFSGARKEMDFMSICRHVPDCAGCPISNQCIHVQHKAPMPGHKSRPIKTWSSDARPRERLLAGEKMQTSELLAIILGAGSGTRSAIDLANDILAEFESLHGLDKASPQDIKSRIKGIGPAKAAEIKAAIELGKRIVATSADDRDALPQIPNSGTVFNRYRPVFKTDTQERFLLLVLNTKNRLVRDVEVSVGTLNGSIVHPRDVFNHAIRESAAAVMFVHNHPSGDPTPSSEDRALTARLAEAGKLLGIRVLDHIIIGSTRYYSFHDSGDLR